MITHKVTTETYIYPVYKGSQRVQENGRAPLGLICTGNSGIMISQAIWTHLPHKDICEIFYIRKKNEISHGYTDVMGTPDILILVDDFISLGHTMHEISKNLSHLQRSNVKAIAVQATEIQIENSVLPLFPNINHLIS